MNGYTSAGDEFLVVVGREGKVVLPLPDDLRLIADDTGLCRILWRPNRVYNVPDDKTRSFHAHADELVDGLIEEIRSITFMKANLVDMHGQEKYTRIYRLAEEALLAFMSIHDAKVVVVKEYEIGDNDE